MNPDCHLLVDFENVQSLDFAAAPDDLRVTVFVGSGQKSIPFELVRSLQHLGTRLEWQKVEGGGKNALDFHLAFYFGCCLTRCPGAQYAILSKDTGFDPLIRHLKSQGVRCRRISSLSELMPKSGPTPQPNYQRLVELLSRSKTARPRSRAALVRHASTLFQKKLTEAELGSLVDVLFTERKVTESDGALHYDL
jgi:hypothetical protein